MGQAVRAREEAHVLKAESLSEGQKNSAGRVFELLDSLLDEEATTNTDRLSGLERALAQPTKSRRNHTLLIDGGRGAGKTALLLSLVHHWKERALGRPAGLRAEDATVKPWPDRTAIIPLAIVDLSAMSPGASLLVHLLEVLHQLVDAMEHRGSALKDAEEPVPWSPHASSRLKSKAAWGACLRSATLATEGMSRLAQLDPETLVVERADLERSRLDVLSTFQHFADALVADYRREVGLANHERGPLFLIPIDDADMNPDRVVELLDVVNALRHRHVAFLLVGDTTLFEATLKTHFAGALRRSAGNVALSLDELSELGVHEQVPQLAQRLYEKLVPPSHRCEIRGLDTAERIERLLDGLDSKTHAEIKTSIEGVLFKDPMFPTALPERLRPLLDLNSWLRQTNSGREQLVAEFVQTLWQAAVLEEPALNRSERDRLYEAVAMPDPATRVIMSTVPLDLIDPQALQMVSTVWPVAELPLDFGDPNLRQQSSKLRIVTRSDHRRATIYRSKGDDSGARRLGQRISAAWSLASSVSQTKASLTDLIAPVVVSLQLNANRTVEIPWPSPEPNLDSQALKRIDSAWVKNLGAIHPKAKADPDKYAFAFMASFIDAFQNSAEAESLAASSEPDWKLVIDRLQKIGQSGQSAASAWASKTAILLAAPESGLTFTAAGALLTAWANVSKSNSLRDDMRALRREWLSALLRGAPTAAPPTPSGASADEVISYMLKAVPNHPWNERFENRTGGTP